MTAPGPGTTLRTPSGRPASDGELGEAQRGQAATAEAGFSTTELPVASAAPSFHAVMMSG